MTSYEVTGADGQIYDIEGPEGVPDQEIIAAVQRQILQEQIRSVYGSPSSEEQEEQDVIAAAEATEAEEAARVEEKENTNAFSVAASRAVDDAGLQFGSFQEGLGNLLDSDYLREAGAERIAANEAQLAEAPEAMSYKEVEDLDSFGEYFGETLGGSAPLTATSILAAAATGAAVGSVVPGLGTLAGFTVGAIGGAISQVPFFWGGNRERQKEAIERGERVEIDEGAAALTAIPQAILDSIAERFQITKLFPTQKLLRQGGFFTRIVKGAGAGAVTEVPTELGQTFLERAQAGLDLGSKEAIDEYFEVAVAAGLVGSSIGGTSAAVSPDDKGAGATRASLEARVDELIDSGVAPNVANEQAVKEASEREGKSESELLSILNNDSDIAQEAAEVEALAAEQEAVVEDAAEGAAVDEVLGDAEVEVKETGDAGVEVEETGDAGVEVDPARTAASYVRELQATYSEAFNVPLSELEGEKYSPSLPNGVENFKKDFGIPDEDTFFAILNVRQLSEMSPDGSTEAAAEQARKDLAGSKSAEQLALEASAKKAMEREAAMESSLREQGQTNDEDAYQYGGEGITEAEGTEGTVAAPIPINEGAAEREAALGQPENEGAIERTAEVDARIAAENAPVSAAEESLKSPTDKANAVKPYAVKTADDVVYYFKNKDSAARFSGTGGVIELGTLEEAEFNTLVGRTDLKPPKPLEQTSSTYNKDLDAENKNPGDVVQAGLKTRAKVNTARGKAYAKRDSILKKLNATVTKLKSAGQTSAAAVDNAIKQIVASKAKGFESVTSESALLKQIGTSKEKLVRADDPVFSRVDAANTATESVIKKSQEASETLVELGERITGLEEVGSEGGRPAAVNTALQEIATQKGTTKKEILASIGTTKEKLISNSGEVRRRILDLEKTNEGLTSDIGKRRTIGKKLADKITKSNKARAKAVPEAVKEISIEEGITTKQVYELLGTTDEVLASDPARGALSVDEEANFDAQVTQDVLSKITELDKLNRFLGVSFNPELDKALDNDVMVPLWNNDLKGALEAVAKMLPSTPQFAGMVAAARKLSKVVGDTGVVVVPRNPTTKLDKAYRGILESRKKPVLGMYLPDTNVILLEEGVQSNDTLVTGLTAATLLHEMSHAATAKFVKANPEHTSVIQIKELFEQFKQDAVVAGRTKDDLYAMTNVYEFVAEAYGTAEFQQYLASAYVTEGNSNTPVVGLGNKLLTMWQKLKNAVWNILNTGTSKTVPAKTTSMSESIRTVIDTLLAPNYNDRGTGVLLESQTSEDLSRMLSDMDKVSEGINRRYASTPTKGTGNSYINSAVEFLGSVGTRVQKTYFNLTPSLAMADVAGWYSKDLGALGLKLHIAMEEQRGALQKAEKQSQIETRFLNKYLKPITTALAPTTEASKKRLKEVKLLNNLLGESTIREVDLRLNKKEALEKYGFDSEAYGAWKDFNASYQSLSSEGKQVYSDMIDGYAKLYEKLIDTMKTSLGSLKGVGAKEKKQLQGIYKDLLVQRKEAYLPLHRNGKYRLSFDAFSSDSASTEPVFLMFETRRARDLYIKNVLTDDSNVVTDGNDKPKVALYETGKDQQYAGVPSGAFIDKLLSIIPKDGSNTDLSKQIVNMYVEALPQSAIAKSFQKRQNIAGYDGQFTSEFGGHVYDLNRKITLMNNKAKITKILEDIKAVPDSELGRAIRPKVPFSTAGSLNIVPLTSVKEGGGGGIVARQSLIERAEFALDPTQNAFQWPKKLNRFAFLWTIGFNASSAIVNLSQIPIFIFTQLAGVHGVGETVSALRFAMSNVLGSGMTRLDAGVLDRGDTQAKSWVLPSIENMYVQDSNGNFTLRKDKKLSANRKRYLEELAPLVKLADSRGQLTSTAVSDYLGINESGRSANVMDRVTTLSALMFHAVEQFNRQVTMIAAYKLELEQVRKDNAKMTTRELQETAAQNALLRTQEFNGGAVLETAAPLFQQGLGRVAGMYKGFGVQMYYTMFKSAKVALTKEFPGDSPKQKEVRKAARNQIIGAHGASLLFSGVGGMPIYGSIAAMYDMMIKEDDEETFEELTRRHLGTGWYKGAISDLLGLDVSRRMALTNLVLQENRYAYNESFEKQAFTTALGPAGSITSQIFKGYKNISEGKTEQGIDQMLPAAVKNIRKAMKIEDQGLSIKNSMGSTITRDVTPSEMLGQYIGFSPLRYSLNQEDISARKRIDVQLNDNRKNLLSNLNKAKFFGDFEEIDEANKKINEYNERIAKKYPKEWIDTATVGKSWKTYLKNRGQAIFGQTLSSKSSIDIFDQMFRDTSQ